MRLREPETLEQILHRFKVSHNRATWCVDQVRAALPKEERHKLSWLIQSFRDMAVYAGTIDELVDAANPN